MELGDSEEGVEFAREIIEVAISNGLRATVGSGSLLTGSLYIGLEFYDDIEEAGLGSFKGYPTIPSIQGGGLGRIQAQVSTLLEKLNALPLENTLVSAEQAITELQGMLAAARVTLEQEQMRQLPADLHQTLVQVNDALTGFSSDSAFQEELVRALVELKEVLQGARGVTDQLMDNPNSLVFPTRNVVDPEPRAPRQ
jgi:paraquat-inducible protein B